MKKIILSISIIFTFFFCNYGISQNLCHEGSGGGPCFTAEIVEKTKELKLVSSNGDKTKLFKYLNSPKKGEKIYSDGKNKLLLYIEAGRVLSIRLLVKMKFGEEIFEKGLYSQPGD